MNTTRRNLILLGIIGLYLGVFMTGMALPFDKSWPVSYGAMMLYTYLMRPREQWMTSGKLLGSLLVIAAVVALIVYAGSGLATVIGAPPEYLGPVLAFGSVALSRAVWSAAQERELAAFLADAKRQLEGGGSGEDDDSGKSGPSEREG